MRFCVLLQDMACDTFIKIAQKCRRHFVHVQAGEVTPFIEEILSTISTIICDLQPQQVHTFYEAVGYMISAQNEKFVQEPLIERYMLLPNQVWDDIINQATRNVDVLKDPDAVKQLANILKVRYFQHKCFRLTISRILLKVEEFHVLKFKDLQVILLFS